MRSEQVSMNLKPFQAIFPELSFITSPDHFFSSVREQYNEYKESGFFNKTASEGMYIYQIQTNGKSYMGLVTCIDINDYRNGKIKRHENTLAAKEQQQMHLMLKREAQVKPVLLTYKKVEKIDKILNQVVQSQRPFQQIHFEQSNQKHVFWKIMDGKTIQKLQKIFAEQVDCTYIADGHHRTSTTAIMDERMTNKKGAKSYDQLLCALFPTTELEILDFNRVIEVVGDFSA